jgi:hypothetical protein
MEFMMIIVSSVGLCRTSCAGLSLVVVVVCKVYHSIPYTPKEQLSCFNKEMD